jgi:hypothetical protein
MSETKMLYLLQDMRLLKVNYTPSGTSCSSTKIVLERKFQDNLGGDRWDVIFDCSKQPQSIEILIINMLNDINDLKETVTRLQNEIFNH